MPESLLLRLRLDQARSLRDTLESWQARYAPATNYVQDVAAVVRLHRELARELEGLYEAEYERAVLNDAFSVADLRTAGAALAEVFRLSAQSVALLRQILAGTEQQAGHTGEGKQQLEEAQALLDDLRARLDREWPVSGPDDAARARAELARGEALDLEEAFAGMAGISREELRHRLDEHRRKRQALGME